MTPTIMHLAILLCTWILPAVWPMICQNPDPSLSIQREENVITLNARVVNLNVSVTDQNGKKVNGLKLQDFLVMENRVPQEVIHFEPVEAPVTMVLLLDLSGSIGSKLIPVKKAAKRFIDSLKPDDTIAVGAFTTNFILVSSFTKDRSLLKARIDRLENPEGDTAFYDAAWTAFDLLETIKDVRKAVVVLTDGVDSSFRPDEEGSKRSFDELLMRAVEEDATVYPIYIDTERESGGHYSAESFAMARKQLRALGEQTGGTHYSASRIEDLDGVYQQVSAELHALYSVAYAAKDPQKDGKWRTINVQVNREGVKAKAKRGYYAK